MENWSRQSMRWSKEVLRNTAIFQKLSSLLLSMNGGLKTYHTPVIPKIEQELFFSCSLKDGRASSLLLSVLGSHYFSLGKSKPPRDSFSWGQATSKLEWCWLHQAADLSYISFWQQEKLNLLCSHAVSVLSFCSGLAAGKPEVLHERNKPLERGLWFWR